VCGAAQLFAVIGWAIDEHMHADRGCQYTSAQLARFTHEHNVVRSVGRTAVCWDNAQAESFWATLKVEFYGRYLWLTKAAAKLAVADWIERVYNRRRRHSAIDMISPVEFENRRVRSAQAA
jgi:transposase InsO family protein